jgi:hypothetical protein
MSTSFEVHGANTAAPFTLKAHRGDGMVQALTLFDHYHFRVLQKTAKKKKKKLELALPPRKPGEKAWWAEDYTDPRKIRDRELFS